MNFGGPETESPGDECRGLEENRMFQISAPRVGYKSVLAIGAILMLSAMHPGTADANEGADQPAPPTAASDVRDAAPIYGITIPAGYRDWKLISLSRLEGKLNQLRAQFGNDIAVNAIKEGTLPFPDGSVIAAAHWTSETSASNNEVLSVLGVSSSVPGAPVNVQFMVKDSKKYASTGGWGFADFKNGKPGDEALHSTCFACHQPAKAHDYVFTHYAPAP
jgi:hypothetical protein